MLPSKSREHRLRVLENQTKLASTSGLSAHAGQGDAQMKIPLVVEVKGSVTTKQRLRRSRGRSRKDQPEFGDL